MSIDERRKYLYGMQQRYQLADKQERSALLDEMEQVTGQHRKHLIRLMKGSLERKPRTQQRGRTYSTDADDAIRFIAECLDDLCAERVTPALAAMAKALAYHGEMHTSPELLEQLGRISISTVQRTLKRIRQDQPQIKRRPRSGPPSGVAQSIPIRRIPWDERQPGHFEVDLVYHSGPVSTGDFMHTLQIIDVATGWSERSAVLGRSFVAMRDGFQRIQLRIPFRILELHPDNGSEFLNWNLVRFWRKVCEGVTLSRSFPYHKNDNRFVEQKNAQLVRAYLGHERLDSAQQVNLANELYDKLWLYNNFFQPVMRLKEKVSIPTEDGVRVLRRHDRAQTPLDRLLATDAVTSAQREELLRQRDEINPRRLKEEVYELIDRIFALPNVAPGEYDDIASTLLESTRLAALGT